jgi:hypothetical protein
VLGATPRPETFSPPSNVAHHGVGTQPQQQPTYTAIPPAQKMPDVRLALMVMRQAISNPATQGSHAQMFSHMVRALNLVSQLSILNCNANPLTPEQESGHEREFR